MNELGQLPIKNFPKMMNEIFRDQKYLKIAVIFLASLLFFNAIFTFIVMVDGPIVLAFDESGKEVNVSKNMKAENQIKMALQTYVNSRYNWDAQSIEVKLKDAKNFIEQKNEKLFDKAMEDLLKFAKDKAVTQKTYVESVNLDLKSHVALVTGDLVTSIQGLKAVSNLRLTLEFTEGRRTYLNPWGIYITKEKEQ